MNKQDPAETHFRHRHPLPRLATAAVRRSMGVFPVTVVTGARQTGKTTLVRDLLNAEDRLYLSLDDLDVRDDAARSPDELVARAPAMTLDEVQREPELLLAIKRAVDRGDGRRPGRFVLTGSANLLLMEKVADSLAGRAGYVTLRPFTRQELLGRGAAGIWSRFLSEPVDAWYDFARTREASPEDWRDAVRRGGYPVAALELDADEERAVWFDGYVRTYLERDLQDLSAVQDLVDFRRLMKATALRIGGLVNQSEVGRDTGIPQPTVHRYLNLLETSYQIIRLQPYSVNRTKRLIKSPKYYWCDTGLALRLAGEEPRGAHLENLLLSDLLAWKDGLQDPAAILYWRTASGQEVDLLIESRNALLPIEVKAAARPSSRDARHLRAFLDQYPDMADGGLVLHGGPDTYWVADRILAAPWWRVV